MKRRTTNRTELAYGLLMVLGIVTMLLVLQPTIAPASVTGTQEAAGGLISIKPVFDFTLKDVVFFAQGCVGAIIGFFQMMSVKNMRKR